MAPVAPPLRFEREFDAQTGTLVAIAPGIARLTAPNAGPYTFTGTNTFILGTDRVAIIDPGPDDARHYRALLSAIGGRPVEAILLTHTHRDHSAMVPRLRQASGAPVWFEGRHRLSRPRRLFEINAIAGSSDWALTPDRVLRHGERFSVAGVALDAIATPGHCANHMAFGVLDGDLLLTGDHIMGWNSTLVSSPDGSMRDYFSSLERVIALPYRRYLPAHGGPIASGPDYARALLLHRQLRNQQIIEAVRGGACRIADLMPLIYPQLALNLQPAARMTLGAHIEYLEGRGDIVVTRRLWRERFRAAQGRLD